MSEAALQDQDVRRILSELDELKRISNTTTGLLERLVRLEEGRVHDREAFKRIFNELGDLHKNHLKTDERIDALNAFKWKILGASAVLVPVAWLILPKLIEQFLGAASVIHP